MKTFAQLGYYSVNDEQESILLLRIPHLRGNPCEAPLASSIDRLLVERFFIDIPEEE